MDVALEIHSFIRVLFTLNVILVTNLLVSRKDFVRLMAHGRTVNQPVLVRIKMVAKMVFLLGCVLLSLTIRSPLDNQGTSARTFSSFHSIKAHKLNKQRSQWYKNILI